MCDFCKSDEHKYRVAGNEKVLCEECHRHIGIDIDKVIAINDWVDKHTPEEEEHETREFTTSLYSKFKNPSSR
jgi:hypothetical protein